MKRKRWKAMLGLLCGLLALWVVMFTTDYLRCSQLKEPVFVLAGETADDGGSGTYYGLGYTVEMEKHGDVEGSVCLDAVTMKILGGTAVETIVAAAIGCR